MRMAIIGGTFDPVHCGHLHVLHLVLDTGLFDTILLVPACTPVHKSFNRAVSDSDRLAMLELAVAWFLKDYNGNTSVVVDDCELKRTGFSYMIDTVEDVVDRYRADLPVSVVLGDDLLNGLSHWHRFRELCEFVEFVVVNRFLANTTKSLPDCAQGWFLDNCTIVDSSTEVRSLLAEGNEIGAAKLVPAVVMEYIKKHGLYIS